MVKIKDVKAIHGQKCCRWFIYHFDVEKDIICAYSCLYCLKQYPKCPSSLCKCYLSGSTS